MSVNEQSPRKAYDRTDEILKVENATIQFGGVVAVNDLDLVVRQGEIVSLIGPNGAGKTTAFNIITGVYAPTNGAVYFKGQKVVQNHPRGKMKKLYAGKDGEKYMNFPVIEPSPDELTKLGMARTFQNIRLFKSRTVFENILIAKHLRRTSNFFEATFGLNKEEEEQMKASALDLLKIVGLEDVKDELATSLPYGKQRRLEIARAMATSPELLLLDEPAAGMNPQETLELAEFIKELRDKYQYTILIIEHHMDLVMKISERIYVLEFGHLIAEGTPAEIQNNEAVINAYLGVSEDA
ncbi:MAG: ABC transporter ATP-binding protein [Eubacteriales bacterium]|nr:ABC transporter ATP-binding protein [Eubacteriales bacterium]